MLQLKTELLTRRAACDPLAIQPLLSPLPSLELVCAPPLRAMLALSSLPDLGLDADHARGLAAAGGSHDPTNEPCSLSGLAKGGLQETPKQTDMYNAPMWSRDLYDSMCGTLHRYSSVLRAAFREFSDPTPNGDPRVSLQSLCELVISRALVCFVCLVDGESI
jgi:hypothetical protein